MSLSINPYQYQQMQAGAAGTHVNPVSWGGSQNTEGFGKQEENNAIPFIGLTSSSKGVDHGLFAKNANPQAVSPITNKNLVANLDKLNPYSPDCRTAQVGQRFCELA